MPSRLAALAVLFAGCGAAHHGALAARCHHSAAPDPVCTPGAALKVSAAQVCVPGYSKHVRKVSEATKRRVFAEYGIASHQPGEYEVDHRIPLELGGSNDIANLWPQQSPGYHVKDALENELHLQVCSFHRLTLAEAHRLDLNWSSRSGTLSGHPGVD